MLSNKAALAAAGLVGAAANRKECFTGQLSLLLFVLLHLCGLVIPCAFPRGFPFQLKLGFEFVTQVVTDHSVDHRLLANVLWKGCIICFRLFH